MPAVDRSDLARHMAELTSDRAMVVPFVETYRDNLRGVVRRILYGFGRLDLAEDTDEVSGLVWDVALVLQQRARAWDPSGGALPWYWASRAIRSEIARLIGHAHVDIDIEAVDLSPEAQPATAGGTIDFYDTAAYYPGLRRLLDAIHDVASPRHT